MRSALRDPSRHTVSPLTLAEIVDLQALLERDADEDEQALMERDGAIGRRVNAAELEDASAIRAWLGHVQSGQAPSLGSRLEQWGSRSSWLLRAAAALAGLSTVAGWLQLQGRQPVNVINFWAAIVGAQLLFVVFLAYSIARWRWFVRQPKRGTREPTQRLPWVAAAIDRLWMRTAKAGQPRGVPVAVWAKVRRMFGEVMGWQALRWAQWLAVFYNAGAVVALVLWSTISDPSFGWRSTLLDAEGVAAWSRSISWPWAWLKWGRPSFEDVLATRYSSLDQRFLHGPPLTHEAPLWAAWWPFLLMSLLVYGLLPRLLTYAWTSWRARKALLAAPWRSAAAEQVLHRMRRAGLTLPQPPASEAPMPGRRARAQEGAIARSDGGPVCVMVWAGISFASDDALAAALRLTLAKPARAPVAIVGGKDLDADEVAINNAARAEGRPSVAVFVQGWDPPVGEHIDFLSQLRQSMGEKRRVDVIVCGLPAGTSNGPPTEGQMRLWRNRIEGLGDPWLAVHALRVQEGAT